MVIEVSRLRRRFVSFVGDNHEFCLVAIKFSMFAVAEGVTSLVHDCIE